MTTLLNVWPEREVFAVNYETPQAEYRSWLNPPEQGKLSLPTYSTAHSKKLQLEWTFPTTRDQAKDAEDMIRASKAEKRRIHKEIINIEAQLADINKAASLYRPMTASKPVQRTLRFCSSAPKLYPKTTYPAFSVSPLPGPGTYNPKWMGPPSKSVRIQPLPADDTLVQCLLKKPIPFQAYVDRLGRCKSATPFRRPTLSFHKEDEESDLQSRRGPGYYEITAGDIKGSKIGARIIGRRGMRQSRSDIGPGAYAINYDAVRTRVPYAKIRAPDPVFSNRAGGSADGYLGNKKQKKVPKKLDPRFWCEKDLERIETLQKERALNRATSDTDLAGVLNKAEIAKKRKEGVERRQKLFNEACERRQKMEEERKSRLEQLVIRYNKILERYHNRAAIEARERTWMELLAQASRLNRWGETLTIGRSMIELAKRKMIAKRLGRKWLRHVRLKLMGERAKLVREEEARQVRSS